MAHLGAKNGSYPQQTASKGRGYSTDYSIVASFCFPRFRNEKVGGSIPLSGTTNFQSQIPV